MQIFGICAKDLASSSCRFNRIGGKHGTCYQRVLKSHVDTLSIKMESARLKACRLKRVCMLFDFSINERSVIHLFFLLEISTFIRGGGYRLGLSSC